MYERDLSFGVVLVAVDKKDRIECNASVETVSTASRLASWISVREERLSNHSVITFHFRTILGLYGEVRLVDMPFSRRYCCSFRDMNDWPRALCTKAGAPINGKVAKSDFKHLIPVLLWRILVGNAKRNLEYSSITVNMYLLGVLDGSRPEINTKSFEGFCGFDHGDVRLLPLNMASSRCG